MKLTAYLVVILRGLDLPGPMGETYLRMRASTAHYKVALTPGREMTLHPDRSQLFRMYPL